MKKTRSMLMVCILLLALSGLLAACGGVSPREQAMSTELSALQTKAAKPLATAVPATAAPAPTVAPTPAPSTSSGLAARIDEYMRGQTFSGAVFVAQKGKVLFSKGYNLANRELDVPNTPQTKFAIGSMTKAFTVMAIMILQERGKLSVQDSICKYIKDCPAAWKPITLHQLLTHTSGIHNYTEAPVNEKINACQQYTPQEVIALFKDMPLDFAPGKAWYYSNSGYFLLGMVIEKASGASYENFIQENIFQPLGMSDSGYDRASDVVKNRATGYTIDEDKVQFVNVACWDVSTKYAAGAVYSTVGDLYKWDQALYTDQLVSKESLNTLFTSTVFVTPGASSGDKYGYGWIISQEAGRQVIWHNGRVFGFGSILLRYPDDQTTVIVLSNFDTLVPDVTGNAVADIVLGEK